MLILPKFNNSKLFRSYSDSMLLPEIIQLDSNLFMIAFKLMKLLPAKFIVTEALKRGDIKDNYVIVDTSSGTFALGLGIVCLELGLKFKIFSDPIIDKSLKSRLQDLGGSVDIITKSKNKGAYQKERLKALHTFISKEKLNYWTKQYDNPDNAKSYAIVGDLLVQALGKNINIVGAVGSGGSTGGIISAVREYSPNCQLTGVDTYNSVLFGQPDGKRELRGLGNTILPKNLDHSLYDTIHWISARDAYHYTRLLHNQKALFYGPTTGAAFQVAQYLANKNKNEVYAFIGPDEGYRYSNTVYNEAWLKRNSFYNKPITSQPKLVNSPLEAVPPWSMIKWDRRKLMDVIK